MHPNPLFRWDDRDALRAYAATRGFGTLAGVTPEGIRMAHIPFVWLSDDSIGFHLARANALTAHLEGQRAMLCVAGPDAYVSPDWYGMENQVPTWNYLAAEFEGPVRVMDEAELVAQADALSAAHEERLAPKQPWTRAKMAPGTFERMLGGIRGFALQVENWRGTRKLGQNKPAAARMRVAEALEAHAAPGAAAMAKAMREDGDGA